jgi:hypothetical protein
MLFGVGGWVALRLFTRFSRSTFELASGGRPCRLDARVIFGLPALRMRGLYFALITLADDRRRVLDHHQCDELPLRAGPGRQGHCRRAAIAAIRRWRAMMRLLRYASYRRGHDRLVFCSC